MPNWNRYHEELRRIIPKGKTNFDKLSNRDMAVCMSHVNSYGRDSLGWAAPYDLARLILPADLMDGLGIERIPANDVNLTPYLVPHAMIK